ncbi:acetoacetyl-CoA synthetase [Tistlia consotensis]|uniref:Acetoacetyl-CoA synthetase n=1 Tax=Tistlia consotensis USBA 355 TaxID=560819 RepID=A0A1Y6C032_9PROT|nr:acetoacetate--CoA ligase [Tistlia consotensis]SMF38655.1 acetoacetyl-CoA synthetase [Tistlia consotensis USBA 355]SNR36944.1 acetoacetyl-CoA synthetase [Tistlia consotensis]
MTETQPLWTPSPERVADANLTRFMQALSERSGLAFGGYDALYDWSIRDVEGFWRAIWDWCGVIGEGPLTPGLLDGDRMPGARFFPEVTLNFAENLLRRNDGSEAIVFRSEDKAERRLTWAELTTAVSRTAQALAAEGVGPGDRVAAYLPNMPETVIAMLATAALGAVFSSCSPDFGEQGVLDRFGQIEPKVLFACDGYFYAGKTLDIRAKVRAVAAELPSVGKVVLCPLIGDGSAEPGVPKGVWLADFLAPFEAGPIAYLRQGFNAPLYIMFSSGTTGKPKCIVHGVGGTLLQHLKEHRLQSDVKPGDRIFYFTTCGWMMWNWLVSGLASEATLLLYDGSPFHPTRDVVYDYLQAEKASLFGTSAKYIDACAKAGLKPIETHDLSSVRVICSTGSPLVPESFDYVYRDVKKDVCLSSISGGTDIVSCFVLGNPIGPVWRGEIQARGLGMAVEVWNDEGQPVVGEQGELVCVRPFPSMPLCFWNDPDGERYRAAYFERFPGVWCHGDFVELTTHGGIVIYGRSDAVLNPGGVRIGTAEIYRQVEKLPEVLESIVIGQNWDGDVRVVLFVKLAEGKTLDDELVARIRKTIREGASPRHVPAKILAVPDIPRTRSGKIVELAVRDVVHGRPIKNQEALANPEALDHYRDRSELKA